MRTTFSGWLARASEQKLAIRSNAVRIARDQDVLQSEAVWAFQLEPRQSMPPFSWTAERSGRSKLRPSGRCVNAFGAQNVSLLYQLGFQAATSGFSVIIMTTITIFRIFDQLEHTATILRPSWFSL